MCKAVAVSHQTLALTLVSSHLTVAADAGDAAEDPGSNAHPERRLLTQDTSHAVHFSLSLGLKKTKTHTQDTLIPL